MASWSLVAAGFFPAGNFGEANRLLLSDLTAARTYQVTPAMVENVTDLYKVTDLLYLTAGREPATGQIVHQPPSAAGFVWLDKPVTMYGALVRAFSWGQQPLPGPGGTVPGVRAAAWNSVADHDEIFTRERHQRWLEATGGRGRLILVNGSTRALGEPPEPEAGAACWRPPGECLR